MPTTRYLDMVGGNNSNDGSTFALRKLTLASACSGLTGGDTVRVIASPDPTSLSQSATFTNGSDTVTLTTAVTANIDTCEAAWTASANVTATAQSTTQREGTNAASLAIASGFTTGLVAYHAMSATDFSGYKQISFLVRTNAALAASVLSLNLCSDAAGATPVNTVAIPAITSGYWTAVVVDTAAALGASIQSVSISAASDPGTITVFLDNIIACKDSTAADSLTHYSLISKNTGTEPWMAIDSINGTTIKLAGGYQATASRSTYQPYYYGTTATVTIYKREPLIVTSAQVSGSGTSENSRLSIEGGWDRTAMSSQSGQSFLRFRDPSQGSTALFDANTSSNVYLNKWYSVNSIGSGVIVNRGSAFGEVGAIACGVGFYLYQTCSTQAATSATRYAVQCGNGVKFSGSPAGIGIETTLRFNYMWGFLKSDSSYPAINDTGTTPVRGKVVVFGADIQGHYCYSGNANTNRGAFSEITFQGCTLKNMNRDTSAGPEVVNVINSTIASITNQTTPGVTGTLRLMSQGGDTTSHLILFGSSAGSGVIASDTSVRHTASDFSWKLTPNLAVGTSANPALYLSIAKIACVANEQRTVKAYLRRSNTGLTVQMRLKGGDVAGVDDDVVSSMSAAINTWEQITLQFTPTQQCVAEIFVQCYGVNGADAWVDDLSVT